MRCVEMHDWPAWLKPATEIFFAAVSISPSASMMTGALFPSSRFTFFFGARWRMPHPTSGEPVKVISAMSGSSTIAFPTVAPPPVTMWSCSGGQAAFVEQQPRERDCRQGRLARGLQHDGTARRDRGCELVRDEVQREVERRDCADHADRHAHRERELSRADFARVERHHLARQRARRDRRERERRRAPLRLDARGLDRLRRFLRDQPRQLLGALGQRAARRDPRSARAATAAAVPSRAPPSRRQRPG